MTKDGGIHHLDLCVTLTANVPGSVLKLFQCSPDNQMQVKIQHILNKASEVW